MPTYTPADFECIAAAIGVPVSAVQTRASRFESAASWIRLDRGSGNEEVRQRHHGARTHAHPAPPPPRPRTPFNRSKTMLRVAESCHSLRKHLELGGGRTSRREASVRRLLKNLAIEDAGVAEDGPGDPEILQVLTFPEGSDEDHVLNLIRRSIAADPHEQITALRDLEGLARQAAIEAVRLGELTGSRGHHGDRAVTGWIEHMLVLYEEITGNPVGTSVAGPDKEHEGTPGGPLIRFLEAAGKPLVIQFSPEAWRSRIRTFVDGRSGQY